MNVAVSQQVEDLFVAGAGHAYSAIELAGDDPAQAFYEKFSASIFLLMGFALELTLKAVALHMGGDAVVMKREVGHKLIEAFDYAKAQGWRSNVPFLYDLVVEMDEVHRSNFFRYMSNLPDPELPRFDRSLPVLRDHVRDVAATIFA